MKIVYMGTPQFAVPCLETLVDDKHEIIGVFTQPDRPSGRGRKINITPVKEKALEHNIPVFQPNTLKDVEVFKNIEKLNPDIIIVVAYGQLLPTEILRVPKYGCINVHASLLPKYRGAAPINWAVINGEESTGITTIYMDAGLDTGDILLKEEIKIYEDETAGELHNRLMYLGAEVLDKTIDLIGTEEIRPVPQNHKEASYAPMLTKEHGKIDWSRPAEEIKNLIRGTIPWPTPYTTYNGKIMKVWKGSVIYGNEDHKPGTILEVKKDCILVATGKDILSIEELQFSGRKKMSVNQYLVGNNIEPGIILGEQYGD
ncbi:MAG: methionyl-tRNA formyltransferase [Natronincolaceae bacterium]|nr:methionyl-tRNA formyltransferase [Bacillota bacterium]NLK91087.1 methionyl-tRNA formyltransferase [Clostridiales bacterium]